ncbi:MAG: succinate dehydrogenase cytochrome b subunit [Bacteroidota bacterium]
MSNSLLTLSSVTKKFVMAFAGIFLMVFLLVHLAINLCLLRSDDGVWFNAAAHFMGTNYVVKVFEIVLMAGFLIHIFFGILLQIQNWMARPVRYMVSNKTTTSFLSKYMIYTGGIVFIFLIIHFMNFYFRKIGIVELGQESTKYPGEPDFYKGAIDLFHNNVYSILYIVLIGTLGFHLNHAFQAAFQSIGLNHPKYTPCIKGFSTVYSIIIAVGFCIIPIFFMFFK